jgi:hypothetical protein
MRALLSKIAWAADLLVLRDIPEPVPGPGEVRIRVHSSRSRRAREPSKLLKVVQQSARSP